MWTGHFSMCIVSDYPPWASPCNGPSVCMFPLNLHITVHKGNVYTVLCLESLSFAVGVIQD